MNRSLLLPGIALGLLLMGSCKKENTTQTTDVESIDQLVVPAGFDWSSSRDVTFSVSVSDSRFGSALHVISIYAGDPASGGSLISKGSASITSPFNTKINLPDILSEVYIVKTAPDGSTVQQKVTINGTSVSVSAGAENMVTSMSAASAKLMGISSTGSTPVFSETSPDCTTGCGTVISTSPSQSMDLNGGQTYCVTGSNITVTIQNTNGGTLRICGQNVTIKNLKVTAGVTVIVAAGGSVNFDNFNWDGNGTFKNFGIASTGNFKVNSGTFINQGTLSINGTFTVASGTSSTNSGVITASSNFDTDGTFVTSGNMTINGTTELKSNSNFTNSGILTFTGNTSINNNLTNSGTINWTGGEIFCNNDPTVTNSGTITANSSKLTISGIFTNRGSVTVNTLQHNSGSGKLINYCKFVVLENAIFNTITDNHSYFKVGKDANMNGSSVLNLYDGAMFVTNTLSNMDGIVTGTGATSLFKVVSSSDAKVNDNGSNKFRGTLQYCDPSRTIKPEQFSGGAVQKCDVYIGVSECNPVGNGTPPRKDSDGDGIYDDEDAYPHDASKAFNNYQVNYNSGGSTVAFEDNWPKKGDFDVNDVVLSYRYNVITNASNQVVQIKADYKLLATGGTFENGAGIQFNIPASKAGDVSGAVKEDGQDSLVVILFSNSRQEQANWNTSNDTKAASKDYSVSIDIKPGILLSALGIGNYNVFIWNNSNGYGRGYETHLAGKAPTKKANTALFGTGDDNSVNGKRYTTKEGLPWGLEIPISGFEYPLERTDITQAYTKFAGWATSSGENFKDWYSNTAYQNSAKIFKP